MFSEIFKHVLGENVFLQFIAVKIPWQSFYKNFKKMKNEKNGREGGRESLATCVSNEDLM